MYRNRKIFYIKDKENKKYEHSYYYFANYFTHYWSDESCCILSSKKEKVGEPFRMNDDNNSEWFIKFNESKGNILEKINLLTTGNRDSLDKINDTLNQKISGFQKMYLINLTPFHPLLENLLRIIVLNRIMTLRN